jgi:hypothetical protein
MANAEEITRVEYPQSKVEEAAIMPLRKCRYCEGPFVHIDLLLSERRVIIPE